MKVTTAQDCIKFGDAASIERHLIERCNPSLKYLNEKGVLRLVANAFANQKISTVLGDKPFYNKLVVVLADSNLEKDGLTTFLVMPILTSYLKEYVQQKDENKEMPYQKGSQNHFYYVVFSIFTVTLSIFAAYTFSTSSTK
jgi:hypothetical protein